MKRTPTLHDRLLLGQKPPRSPVMFQGWRDLLFLHWEIDPAEVSQRIPKDLSVDLHEGKAYLGIVPFFMEKIRPRFLPSLPWLSHFLELNVRTYVHDKDGRPGVWFFSLDCNQPLAVEIARRFFHLPYQHAKMAAEGRDYHCHRKGSRAGASYTYPEMGPLKIAEEDSLEFFLLERYLLFSESRKGQLYTGQVHHQPYSFCEVDVPKISPAPLHWEGFQIKGGPVSSLASPGVDVSIYPLTRATVTA